MQSFEEAMIQLAEGTCEAGDEYHFIYTPDGGFTVSAKKKGSDALTAPIKVRSQRRSTLSVPRKIHD